MRYLMLLAFFVAACAPASARMNRISLGMSKNDVIRALGRPVSVSATDRTEYLNYRFAEETWNAPDRVPYFVRFRDGKVDAYGRLGDFDSTKTPAFNVNVKGQ